MGIILSRFRKKKSTLEILECLEEEIQLIEEYGQTTEQRHRDVVGRLIVVSAGLYVMTASLFYFFFFPASLYDQLLYVVPLLLFPLIIICAKRLVSGWYRRKLSRNKEKLAEMKKQKKELLDEVMDKETYKVAKRILERFAPDQLRKANATGISGPVVPSTSKDTKSSNQLVRSQQNTVQGMREMSIGSSGTEMRRRFNALSSVERVPQRPVNPISTPRVPRAGISTPCLPHTAATYSGTPRSESTSVTSTFPMAASFDTHQNGVIKSSESDIVAASATPATMAVSSANIPDNDTEDEDVGNNDDNVAGNDSSTDAEVADKKREKLVEDGPCEVPIAPVAEFPRPILPRNRTMMDRLVEYLVGDGVNQRYALVCRNCHSHNGMALKEEFEYLAFRCCYCLYWNPARKQRLQSPPLRSRPSLENTTSSESNTDDEEIASKPAPVVPTQEIKEIKSDPNDRIICANSNEGYYAVIAETAETPESLSSTEAEFESLVPDPPSTIPTNEENVPRH